jgi:hypothetical protein
MKFSIEQRVFIVETFARKRTYRKCIHKFRRGHVNAQNVRIWSNENPHVIQQVPLHSEKVGVWCAVASISVLK